MCHIELRGGGGDSGSDSCGESRDQQRTYKSRSVISSESDSDEEPSPANMKTCQSKEPKTKQKGTKHKGVYISFCVWYEDDSNILCMAKMSR